MKMAALMLTPITSNDGIFFEIGKNYDKYFVIKQKVIFSLSLFISK